MKPLNQLTAWQAAAAIERGEATPTAVVQACLERIAERNDEIRAFVACDPELALAGARQAEAMAADAPGGRPLRGIPFAAKDIFDTVDYPTEYGSPIYRGHRPVADAGCVALAKHRGAVLIGKVATGEFATQTPSKTVNPLRVTHTPGGSSSGSGAAVGDYMVPVAFGTQTTGSIVRPAIYCGAVGYKPSFGLIATGGMKPLSPSQDTVGVITRDVADAAFFTMGLHGARDVMSGSVLRPRIGLCLSRQWDYAHPSTIAAIERAADTLEKAGAQVTRFWLPPEFEALEAMQLRLFAFEARQTLAQERLRNENQLSPRLQARLRGGADIGLDEYTGLLQHVAQMRARASTLFADHDVLLYPAADGEAEAGHANSGSPRYGAIWTLLHMPCVSFPLEIGPGGLPLGAQLIGAYGQDNRLLAAARFATSVLGTLPRPVN
ncbi:amidase [Bordetella genomosp. 8]|uniref:Amidase n=1 Tax=Bordetella genomosp. 8 TaxID=1416806 RepID=A0A1W6YEE1_9BORD|nr:amidase [Bordetella genomosp. 8]ARP79422.1 amidase [Bordetella genomosp. 8]